MAKDIMKSRGAPIEGEMKTFLVNFRLQPPGKPDPSCVRGQGKGGPAAGEGRL